MSSNGRDEVGDALEKRRRVTEERIKEFKSKLVKAETLCNDKASVFATGSYGRREASEFSDLDVFIVSEGTRKKPALDPLDQVLVKAELIEANRAMKIKDFSGGGQYLTHYTVNELVSSLGRPEDDATNTFTARMLLLLESTPLVGEKVYLRVIKDVILPYWKDYEDKKNIFRPAFLANDILRMWRTFCVNYEAFTEKEPPARRAKRRLKNYKLKHSRLLTCYSGLLYLLAIYVQNDAVSPEDAITMTSLTPTQRLEWLSKQPHLARAHSALNKLMTQYDEFLRRTDAPEEDLEEIFKDKTQYDVLFKVGNELGAYVLEALNAIGEGNIFHRLLVV